MGLTHSTGSENGVWKRKSRNSSKSSEIETSPFDSVYTKIKEHEQYAELHGNEEYMTRFAQCLSDPDTMRQTYLSLDWAISKEWDEKLQKLEQERARQKKDNKLKNNNEEQNPNSNPTSSVQTQQQQHTRTLSNQFLSLTVNTMASKSEIMKMSEINDATIIEDDDEEQIEEVEEEDNELLTKQEWLMMNPVLENRIPVKLVITDMHANSKTKRNLRNIVSPVLSNFSIMPEFGMFHTALIIGQWKIEWTDSALCVPRKICARASLLTADIDADIATLTDLTTAIDKLAAVITKWNTTYQYTERSYTGQTKGNCQDFVSDVLQELGLEMKFSGALEHFLQQMKKKGKCQAEFKMSEDFRQHFGVREKKIKFETHEQLDTFVNDLGEEFYSQTRDPKWKSEYILLKSFDRGFWLRHIRKENDFSEAGKKCRPLFRIQIVPDLSKGLDGEKQELVHCCPFDNPRESGSILVQTK